MPIGSIIKFFLIPTAVCAAALYAGIALGEYTNEKYASRIRRCDGAGLIDRHVAMSLGQQITICEAILGEDK